MREIKFRAWIFGGVDYGEKPFMEEVSHLWWDYPYLIIKWTRREEWSVINMKDSKNDECALMQYTGLKDKSGVEIYEGDIILADPRHARKRGKGIIEYDDSIYGATFIIKQISPSFIEYSDPIPGDETYEQGFYDEMGKNFSWNAIEVIGNIYENPELLEATP